MSHYRRTEYGPFERGRTYELEYRSRVDHRGVIVDRDLSAAALQIRWRMWRPPATSPASFVLDVVATKISESGGTAGATGLWKAIVAIPKDAPLGTVIVETVLVDTGVADADAPSGKREVPLDAPAQTAIVAAPTA